MRIYQELPKLLVTILCSALLLGCASIVVRSSAPLRTATSGSEYRDIGNMTDGQPAVPNSLNTMDGLNSNPPSETVKLVFIHHSIGDTWLDGGYGDLGAALGDNNYYVSETYYYWGPDCPSCDECRYPHIGSCTDTGHWWEWFRGPMSSTYLSELYTTTYQHADYARPVADPGGENEIIMFKSCFANSRLRGNPDDPPTVGDNPLRSRSWDAQVDGGYVHTVGNAKGIYNDILEYFRTRQDKLFVVITTPPDLGETLSANARALSNWLVHDWLDGYPYHNVAVFDYYNVLTTNGGDADTNDFGWSTGNHHRLVTSTTPITIEHTADGDDDDSPHVLEYPTGPTGGNKHPSPAGQQKAMGEFVPLLNVYYNCWKHGDCWGDVTGWISVTAVTEIASIYAGETAFYTLSLTASEGFTAPVTLTLQGAPLEALASFVPNPVVVSGTNRLSTILYITTATSSLAGTYPMSVTGTSGEVTDTATLTLTINPRFTLTAQPVVRTALPGETAVYTVLVSTSGGTLGTNAFAGPVTLTLQGAPLGTIFSFDPNPVTPPGASQLCVTTTTSAMAGIYEMNVIGTSGMITERVGLTLVMVSAAPSFTLSISPTAHVAKPKQTVSYVVSVIGLGGFGQAVSLTVAGLPTGVGAAWTANPVTPGDSSALRLSIPSSPPLGDHRLQVIGIADTQVVSEDIGLTISYPCSIYLPLILGGVCCHSSSKGGVLR
jgi:hypothetical protein